MSEKVKEYSKKATFGIIIGIFCLCGVVKDIEFLVLKTDRTIIAENIICKLFIIVMLMVVLALSSLSWKKIGFTKSGLLKGMLYGFALGIGTFAVSYFIEFIILWSQGLHPHLEFYITNFTMSEANVTGLSVSALIICLIGNVVNVWAEEGLFRGFFRTLGTNSFGVKKTNLLQSLLFGLWHVISVVLWVSEGSMTIPTAIVFGLGYIALAWILGYEWGLCASLTGTIWMGCFEHFFNNFISNALHTVTITGVDEMQIIRIVISNILSLTVVLVLSRIKKSKAEHIK